MKREPKKTKREQKAEKAIAIVGQRRRLPQMGVTEIRAEEDRGAQAIDIVLRALPGLDDRAVAACAWSLLRVSTDIAQTPAGLVDLLLTAYRGGAPAQSPLFTDLIRSLDTDDGWS